MENRLVSVSYAPHVHEGISVKSVMWQVVAALSPAVIASYIFFGLPALLLTIYSVAAAVISEAIIQKWRGVAVSVADGSAVVTGMLLAFNLPSHVPWWMAVLGSVFSIVVGKQVFGGLGFNILNPALLGRAFLVASWPTAMTSSWLRTNLGSLNGSPNYPITTASAAATSLLSTATPLGVVKALRDPSYITTLGVNYDQGVEIAETMVNRLSSLNVLQSLFWGDIGGCLGETSAIALLAGAAYLAAKHIIGWRIPTFYIGTVAILTYIFGGIDGIFSASLLLPVFHIFSGGLILGAFFMATDMVTSPLSRKGRIYFGIGCGILTALIRLYGGYPEGVSYSILLMNLFVPLIDKYTKPRFFGYRKKKVQK